MATEQQKLVEKERMRLVAVKLVLKAALEQKAAGDDAFVPLYVAVSDYLTTALLRLVDQDWRFIATIRRRVGEREGSVSDEVESILDGIKDLLAGALRVTGQAEAATMMLRKHGTTLLEDFEATIAEFNRYTSEEMGHHGPGVAIAAKYFSGDDWANMAQFTDDVIELENRQYEAVFTALPASLASAKRENVEAEVAEMVASYASK